MSTPPAPQTDISLYQPRQPSIPFHKPNENLHKITNCLTGNLGGPLLVLALDLVLFISKSLQTPVPTALHARTRTLPSYSPTQLTTITTILL